MKALTQEQRRFSLETARRTVSGDHVSRVNPITGPTKLMKVLQAKLQQDVREDPPVSLGEGAVVSINPEVEVGGRKKASKTGAMLWRPSTDEEMGRLLVGPRMGQVATREVFESRVRDLVEIQRAYVAEDGRCQSFDREGFAKETASFARFLDRDHALFKSLNAPPGLEQQQVEARTRLLIERWTKAQSSYSGTKGLDRANERMAVLEAALSRVLDDAAGSRLTKSQAAFVEYRAQVSKFDAKLKGGGREGEVLRSSVAEGMTLERIALLEQLLGQIEGSRAKELILLSAQVALESKREPLPTPLARSKEVNVALIGICIGLGEEGRKPIETEIEQLRLASTEASYLEYMHPPETPRERGAFALQLIALRDSATSLLGKLDGLPGSDYDLKEGYARLVDVLASVDGSLTKLAG